ncbi:hypothetical protein PWT90_03441 [Aphanocladium album]|nr:hypothetical protein PWT90_03441 [Aphanocladium album]
MPQVETAQGSGTVQGSVADRATDALGTVNAPTAAGGTETSADDNTSHDAGAASVSESAEGTRRSVASPQAGPPPTVGAKNDAGDTAAKAVRAPEVVMPNYELQVGSQVCSDAKHPVIIPDSEDEEIDKITTAGRSDKKSRNKKSSAALKRGTSRKLARSGVHNASIAANPVVGTVPSSTDSQSAPQTRGMKAKGGKNASGTIRERNGVNHSRAEPQTAHSTTETGDTEGPPDSVKLPGAIASDSGLEESNEAIDAAGHHEELQTGIISDGSGDHAAKIAAPEVPREDEAGKHTRVDKLRRPDYDVCGLALNSELRLDSDDLQKDANADGNADTYLSNRVSTIHDSQRAAGLLGKLSMVRKASSSASDKARAAKKRRLRGSPGIKASQNPRASSTDDNSEAEDLQLGYNASADEQPDELGHDAPPGSKRPRQHEGCLRDKPLTRMNGKGTGTESPRLSSRGVKVSALDATAGVRLDFEADDRWTGGIDAD